MATAGAGGRGPKKEPNPWVLVARYMQLAFVVPISSVVGYAIGYYLDKLLRTTYLRVVFLLLGIAAGFIELIREVLRDESGKAGSNNS